MHIKKILSRNRRDFHAIYQCEHCGTTEGGSGYDDTNFYQNVIPNQKCPECGKTASGNKPIRTPKYGAHEVI